MTEPANRGTQAMGDCLQSQVVFISAASANSQLTVAHLVQPTLASFCLVLELRADSSVFSLSWALTEDYQGLGYFISPRHTAWHDMPFRRASQKRGVFNFQNF